MYDVEVYDNLRGRRGQIIIQTYVLNHPAVMLFGQAVGETCGSTEPSFSPFLCIILSVFSLVTPFVLTSD